MTDKQIIIDGVDVSGCEYCSRYADTTIYNCDWIGECKEHPNCYYKQLKRKEQECERLKQRIKEQAKELWDKTTQIKALRDNKDNSVCDSWDLDMLGY